jgi:hypothetical protein
MAQKLLDTKERITNKMSIEIFRINENGAGWVDFSEATKDEQMNIELGLMTKQFQMLCFVCHVGD